MSAAIIVVNMALAVINFRLTFINLERGRNGLATVCAIVAALATFAGAFTAGRNFP